MTPDVITRWLSFMESGDTALLDDLLDDDVTFRSPAVFTPQEGRAKARMYLLAGRLESQGGAVLIASDMTAEEADALTASDPYVHAGVATYERVSFNAGFRAAGL